MPLTISTIITKTPPIEHNRIVSSFLIQIDGEDASLYLISTKLKQMNSLRCLLSQSLEYLQLACNSCRFSQGNSSTFFVITKSGTLLEKGIDVSFLYFVQEVSDVHFNQNIRNFRGIIMKELFIFTVPNLTEIVIVINEHLVFVVSSQIF